MNLYPLSFPNVNNTNWNDKAFEMTGFPTKEMYRVWCQNKRFPLFKEWLSHGKSKIVVACGTTIRSDYILAFMDEKYLYNNQKGVTKTLQSTKKIEIIKAPSNNYNLEYLIIIPFLGGRYGITRDNDLAELGSIIKDLH